MDCETPKHVIGTCPDCQGPLVTLHFFHRGRNQVRVMCWNAFGSTAQCAYDRPATAKEISNYAQSLPKQAA